MRATLLDQVAVGSQRTRYLVPLARGEVRSAFVMTEPSLQVPEQTHLMRLTGAAQRARQVAVGHVAP